MQNVYLVGFMATGKTAAGQELARQMKWRFVDLDALIELKEGRRITDIFARDGEPYFRRLEKKVLKEVSAEKRFVVACGGGIVLDKENIRLMRDTGVIICLTASPGVILERVFKDTHRPLLNVSDPQKQIELLLKLRAPFYALADKSIDTSGLSVKEVVQQVFKFISKTKNKKSAKSSR